MPFQLLNLDGVANYLHLTPADIEQRVKNREIPFEMRGDRVVFRKSEIDAWASQRILGLPGQRLAVPTGIAIELPLGVEAQIRPAVGRLSRGNDALYAENPAARNHPAENA